MRGEKKGLFKYWRLCEITGYISHGSGRGSWARGWGLQLHTDVRPPFRRQEATVQSNPPS